MSDKVEQSEIPIIVRHADSTAKVAKTANSSMSEVASVSKAEVTNKLPVKQEEGIVTFEDGDGTYLKLSGSEEECVFSSTPPETKPTVNVSYHVCM